MKNFNIKRFWRTSRWYFCENRSQLLALSLGFALSVFIIESVGVGFTIGKINIPGSGAYGMISDVTFKFCFFCALITSFYFFCNIFYSLRTKQKRIAFLTLPATNLERYLTAAIMAIVVWPICIFIALILGDTLRMVFFGLLGYGWISNIEQCCEALWPFDNCATWNSFVKDLAENAFSLWFCSFAVLGGTWFRKRSFLIVSGILILLFMLVTYILTLIYGQHVHIQINSNASDTVAYLVSIGGIALAIFNFWLSYKIFKRFQIITSNWTNI